jgi:hypothetical protein
LIYRKAGWTFAPFKPTGAAFQGRSTVSQARIACQSQVLMADAWLGRVVAGLVLGNGLIIGILLLHVIG